MARAHLAGGTAHGRRRARTCALWFLVLGTAAWALGCSSSNGQGDASTVGGGGDTVAASDASAPTDTSAGTNDALPVDVPVSSDSGTQADASSQPSGDVAPDAPPPPDCGPVAQGVRPPPLGEAGGAWDPVAHKLVMLGGDSGFPVNCNPSPNPEAGQWIYDTACGGWSKLAGAALPPPRTRHAAAYDEQNHALYVFGGRWRTPGTAGPWTLRNDVWRLDFATLSWTEVATSGEAPSPRWGAAAGYDPTRDALVVFGGNIGTSGLTYEPTDTAYVLDLGTGAWQAVGGGQGPDARLLAAGVVVPDDDLFVVFAGNTSFFGPMRGDLWALHLDTLQWERLHDGTGTAPRARFWPGLVYDAGHHRLVMFGGHDDGDLGNRNDLWTFDLGTRQWQVVTLGDQINPDAPPPGFCDFPPNFVIFDESQPERRSAHFFAAAGGEAWVYGGKTDCGLADDLWRLDLDSLQWEPVVEPTVGIACERAGIEGCTSYCFGGGP